MRVSGKPHDLPATFSLRIAGIGGCTYRITTCQEVALSPKQAFVFFEDPRNLSEITPHWLNFRILTGPPGMNVFEGAEFSYSIRVFGVRVLWRSVIDGYDPPHRFIDRQLSGPYQLWEHLHTFTRVERGTLLTDEVTYRLPAGLLGKAVHRLAVRSRLEDIFTYRAMRIAEWAEGRFTRKDDVDALGFSR